MGDAAEQVVVSVPWGHTAIESGACLEDAGTLSPQPYCEREREHRPYLYPPYPDPEPRPKPQPNPEQVELPPPCILKPVELWTGKQVFSVLLRPNGVSPLRVNGEGPNKRYNVTRTAPPPLHMCADDGYICFQVRSSISPSISPLSPLYLPYISATSASRTRSWSAACSTRPGWATARRTGSSPSCCATRAARPPRGAEP